jgi:adenosylcobinamide kinase/adenosylcobinamide-phosphate guanylyltransferase
VPPTPLGRAFRDLLGRVNQALAQAAAEVYLLVAGLPVDVARLSRQTRRRLEGGHA